ncbi:MAG: type VI secretion system tip protein VgrG [Deltaproteobacteria bacterium]|nr:type VI secretion system tip protein VgrG [Deltaproteobacteria bacterium]
MSNAQLTFANPELALSVRGFSVHDGLSQLFDVFVTAASRAADLDLETIVGRPAAFRLATVDPERPYAVWSGLCSDCEQIAIEEEGMSIYALRIVPMLWRCTQRRNLRIFQHCTVVEAVTALLADWDIEPELRLVGGALPTKEYRVQFGETDFAFLSRLLEDAGITYSFEQVDPRGEGELETMGLVLTDRPVETARRLENPVPYVGNTDQHGAEPYVSKVRLGRAVRAGRFTIGGFDYRSSPDLRLLAEARAGAQLEQRYELYHYIPGAFLEERGGSAGTCMASEPLGQAVAEASLARIRTRQRRLSFTTNVLDLSPGAVFAMDGHPREELNAEAGVLVVGRTLEGEVDSDWWAHADGVFTADDYRPELVTPKPRVMGVQSAIVVGPEGEEIYTDDLGRVRVQFHWDRYGKRNEDSSCWIRVSQAWAGSGYGMSHIPRVGHEVLVDFFEGDPDRPVVIGRTYNRGASPPDTLPEKKTKSTWRSSSTPGGEGFNEISMDDAAGSEELYLRAQHNLRKIVLADETAAVGQNLVTTVRQNETRTVGADQTIQVKGNRSVEVDGRYGTRSDAGVQSQAGELTGVSCSEGKLVLTNGNASIVLDGPNVLIDAGANLRVSAGRSLGLYGKQVNIDGTPDVFINSTEAVVPAVQQLPLFTKSGEGGEPKDEKGRPRPPRGGDGMPRPPRGMTEAEFERRKAYEKAQKEEPKPDRIALPDGINEQLAKVHRVAMATGLVEARLVDPKTYDKLTRNLDRWLAAEEGRLKKLSTDIQGTFERQRDHVDDLGDRLEARVDEERENVRELGDDLDEIFGGERGNLMASTAALAVVFKDQIVNLGQLGGDLIANLEREKRWLETCKREWTGIVDNCKGYIKHLKDLIKNPKRSLLQYLFGGDKELAELFGLDMGDAPGEIGDAIPHPPPHHPPPPHPPGLGAAQANDAAHPIGEPQLGDYDGKKPSIWKKAKVDTKGVKSPQKQAKVSSKMTSPGQAKAGSAAGNQGMTPTSPQLAEGAAGPSKMTPKPKSFQGQRDLKLKGPEKGIEVPGGKKAYAGTVVSRNGGLSAGDVAKGFDGHSPTFLQSPGEGQLMAVPNANAQPVDAAALNESLVNAQMDGQPMSGAIASSLTDRGYTVYQRDTGDYTSELTRWAGEAQ